MSLNEYEIEVKNMINRIHESYMSNLKIFEARIALLNSDRDLLVLRMIELEKQCRSTAVEFKFNIENGTELLERIKQERYELKQMLSDEAIDSNKLKSIKKICEILRGYEDED